MDLVKVAALNLINVSIRLMLLLVLNKLLAVTLGPTGLAIIGQMQNIAQIFLNLPAAFVANGIIKLTAETNDDLTRNKIWKTALIIAGSISILTMLGLIIVAEKISLTLIGSSDYAYILLILSLSIPVQALNMCLLARYNGEGKIRLIMLSNIVGSLFVFGISIALILKNQLNGALIATALGQATAIFGTITIDSRLIRNFFPQLRTKISCKDVKVALNLAKMGVATVVIGPISYIIVRKLTLDNHGAQVAGNWEAVWRLSAAYMLFITTTITLYYLPKFSKFSAQNNVNIVLKELMSACAIISVIFLFGAVALYSFRIQTFSILFSHEFNEATSYIGYQIVGDFFKSMSIVLTSFMISKGMVSSYIKSEFLFLIFFVGMVYILDRHFEVQSVGVSYVASYIIFQIYVSSAVWKKIIIHQ